MSKFATNLSTYCVRILAVFLLTHLDKADFVLDEVVAAHSDAAEVRAVQCCV